MAKKLFIGSLSFGTTDGQLKDFFSQAGAVDSAVVITDKFSGRSRGFGFVEMPNDEEAQKAIETLNGKELDGRTIVVNEAKPREDRKGGFDRGRGGFDRGGRGGGRDDFRRRDNF